jgi:hypothetical protein
MQFHKSIFLLSWQFLNNNVFEIFNDPNDFCFFNELETLAKSSKSSSVIVEHGPLASPLSFPLCERYHPDFFLGTVVLPD